jgi:hypothetical protein
VNSRADVSSSAPWRQRNERGDSDRSNLTNLICIHSFQPQTRVFESELNFVLIVHSILYVKS